MTDFEKGVLSDGAFIRIVCSIVNSIIIDAEAIAWAKGEIDRIENDKRKLQSL